MIVVAGSTGVLGFEVCRRLREKGKPVRALIRTSSDAGRVAALKSVGCETVTGNLCDRRSLDAACAGASTVITTVTSVTTAKDGDSIAGTDGAGNINLVDAAAAAKVKQFIFVSFDTTDMPESPLTAAKSGVEHRLRGSGMTWTILHPSLFMESWLGPMLFADPSAGTARFYGTRDVRFRYVAVSDVAEVTILCVDNPAAANRVIPFGGPESLTQREALDRFEKAFGRPFTVTPVPEEALEAQYASAADPVMRSFSSIMLAISRGKPSPGVLSEDFSVKMKTVDEFVGELRSRIVDR